MVLNNDDNVYNHVLRNSVKIQRLETKENSINYKSRLCSYVNLDLGSKKCVAKTTTNDNNEPNVL